MMQHQLLGRFGTSADRRRIDGGWPFRQGALTQVPTNELPENRRPPTGAGGFAELLPQVGRKAEALNRRMPLGISDHAHRLRRVATSGQGAGLPCSHTADYGVATRD